MPLTTCPDCQKDVSTEAFVCPNCGRPTGKQARLQKKAIIRGVGLWLIMVILFLAMWFLLNDG